MSYRQSRFRIGKEFRRETERESRTRLKILEPADEKVNRLKRRNQRNNVLRSVESVHERMTRFKRKWQGANAETSATEKSTLYIP